jgi:hypothetical protein
MIKSPDFGREIKTKIAAAAIGLLLGQVLNPVVKHLFTEPKPVTVVCNPGEGIFYDYDILVTYSDKTIVNLDKDYMIQGDLPGRMASIQNPNNSQRVRVFQVKGLENEARTVDENDSRRVRNTTSAELELVDKAEKVYIEVCE